MSEHDKVAGLSLANLWIAFTFFLVAALLGVYQVAERAGYLSGILETPEMYFASVSTHGVLMGFVLTTFFAVAFGNATVIYYLKKNVNHVANGISFFLMIAGTLLAALAMLSGKASVLYTFYPPLQAHPTFYIGAVLLVVGGSAIGRV